MASIDLSAAFDIVNVDLLLKRLKKVGLPDDVVGLIEVWSDIFKSINFLLSHL